MGKFLSVASVIEKNKLSSSAAFVVCLDVGVVDPRTGQTVETLYLVNNTEAITWQGRDYQPVSFSIDLKAEAGAAPSINLSVVDYQQALQARMQEYGGGTGFTVIVSVLNTSNPAQGPEVQEFFEVIQASSANYVCSFTLGAENSVMRQFPRRRQTRDFCQWRYKDPETCGYTGPLPTCDLTLQGPNGCAAHNNSRAFGGFPGINSKVFKRAR